MTEIEQQILSIASDLEDANLPSTDLLVAASLVAIAESLAEITNTLFIIKENGLRIRNAEFEAFNVRHPNG